MVYAFFGFENDNIKILDNYLEVDQGMYCTVCLNDIKVSNIDYMNFCYQKHIKKPFYHYLKLMVFNFFH